VEGDVRSLEGLRKNAENVQNIEKWTRQLGGGCPGRLFTRGVAYGAGAGADSPIRRAERETNLVHSFTIMAWGFHMADIEILARSADARAVFLQGRR